MEPTQKCFPLKTYRPYAYYCMLHNFALNRSTSYGWKTPVFLPYVWTDCSIEFLVDMLKIFELPSPFLYRQCRVRKCLFLVCPEFESVDTRSQHNSCALTSMATLAKREMFVLGLLCVSIPGSVYFLQYGSHGPSAMSSSRQHSYWTVLTRYTI